MIRKSNFLLIAILVLLTVGIASAQTIEEIQQAIVDSSAEWTAGWNEVWELHQDLGWYASKMDFPIIDGAISYYQPLGLADLPRQFDWRDINGKNYVTKIKNQQSCGSCWAFATTGPVESHIAIGEDWPDPEVNLSEQQMLSCCDLPGCASGCNGGFTTSSFDYVRDFGLFDEDCLPYKWDDSIPCTDKCADWQDRLFKIDSWEMIGQGLQGLFPDPLDVMEALQIGPLGTSLTIYNDFFAYTGGIYRTVIGIPQGFHAVTIIGYDADQEYWICKNSWGSGWGEDGFFNIKWGAAQIGMFTILPHYSAQNIPDPDDDTTGDDDDDNDDNDNDDNDNDESEPPPADKNSDDDDSGGSGC